MPAATVRPSIHLVDRHRQLRLQRLARSDARSLERTFRAYRPYLFAALERRVAPEHAAELLAAARLGLTELAPRVPLTRPGDLLRANLYAAAAMLALGRAMRKDGFGDGEIAAVAREAALGRLDECPGPLLRLVGRARFTRHHQRLLARAAKLSQRRDYPGAWVFDAVPGDGAEFGWGVDYRRCPILDLYRAEESEDLMPAVCAIDFAISERMGDGLVRRTTLASGGDRCDFRYTRANAPTGPVRPPSGATGVP